MKFKILLSILFCSFFGFTIAQNYDSNKVKLYIDSYKEWAIEAMKNYHIPASIKLAQGIYHSQAGNGHLPINANNHFGLTCPKGSSQNAYYQDNNKANLCYKRYANSKESYEDHNRYLSTRTIYASLFKLDIYDYKGWAKGLFEAGYTVNTKYPQYLINIIETYNLTRFDKMAFQEETLLAQKVDTPIVKRSPDTNLIQKMDVQPVVEQSTETIPAQKIDTLIVEQFKTEIPAQKVDSPIVKKSPDSNLIQPMEVTKEVEVTEESQTTQPLIFSVDKKGYKPVYYPFTNRDVYENNNTKFIIAKRGDSFEHLALEIQFPEFRLREYNDILDEDYIIQEGEVIYLEAKRNKCAIQFHTIKYGESLRYIAQKYGIKLRTILKSNKGSSFSIGEEICISCK